MPQPLSLTAIVVFCSETEASILIIPLDLVNFNEFDNKLTKIY